MSDTIAVLGGTGALGRALALRPARSGHPVVLGSRDDAAAAARVTRPAPALEATA